MEGDCELVKRYSKAQVWEFVIIVTIILIVLYRWAWLYDYIPAQYQPSTLISNGYDNVKIFFVEEAADHTVLGNISGAIVTSLDNAEKYIREVHTKYRLEEATAAKCQENGIFRFFMNMGEPADPNCLESNLKLKSATDELHKEAQPAQSSTNNAAPAAAKSPTN